MSLPGLFCAPWGFLLAQESQTILEPVAADCFLSQTMVRRPGATPRALGLKQAYRPACQRRPWGPILHQGLLHVSKWSAPTINRDPRVPCLVSPQPSPPQRVRRPEVCPWEQGTRVQRHSGEKRDSANQWAKGSSWDTSRLNLHAQHEGQLMAGKSGGKKEGKAKAGLL